MSLKEYIEVLIPMINLNVQERKDNPTAYKSRQLWYLYRQYFYGFAEFIDRDKLFMVSVRAQQEFKNLGNTEKLIDKNWEHQPQFDKGRKIFNLDHVYTGEMFRNGVDKLIANNCMTVEMIENLVLNNYRMAWILKEEERMLPRSKRGETLSDALEIYETREIFLVK